MLRYWSAAGVCIWSFLSFFFVAFLVLLLSLGFLSQSSHPCILHYASCYVS